MRTRNLWDETITTLKSHGHTFEDVTSVQGRRFEISKELFETLAKDTNYDPGYGRAEIVEDLLIIGDHWWLSRGEYDGKEWWNYHEKPQTDLPRIEVSTLKSTWDTPYLGDADI